MKKRNLTFTLALLMPIIVLSQELSVSLLTCYPGKEVFQLYGHTAIRITDNQTFDTTYNFGMFSFARENFIFHFVKGETDYFVAGYPTTYFLPSYAERNSKVVEQHLNISQEKAHEMMYELNKLCLPENRTYRYNYVLNNCATRPRDIIEAIVGKVTYGSDRYNKSTFRNIMRSYSGNYPWYQFGIDMALGSGIDRSITQREAMFAPIILMESLSDATYVDDNGNRLRLIDSESTLLDGSESPVLPPTPTLLSPLFISCIFLLIILLVTIYDIRRKQTTRMVDTLLFTLAGLAGCLLFFLVFVSEHEATSPNALMYWLNPICLFPAIVTWIKKAEKWLYSYHFLNFAIVLALVIAWPFQSQVANVAFFPLMLCSVVRSAGYMAVYRRCKKRSK